jgi:hypothetical protein
VGITLGGGTSILKRVLVNEGSSDPHPIYLTTQFLSDSEASLLKAAEEHSIDACVIMSRRLTKKTELDDLVRRSLKATLEALLKCEVHVWLSTARHRWSGSTNTEEPFLIAAVSAREGGRAIGKTFPGLESAPFCKLGIGSLELECFREVRHFINKPWKDSFLLTQIAEIGHVRSGLSMGDILQELEGYDSHQILGVTKCDPRSHTDRYDKWLLLVSSDGRDWDKDPRPHNWANLGWTLTVKRPGSPTQCITDSQKYVTLRWDAEGHTISKEETRTHSNLSTNTLVESELNTTTKTSSTPHNENNDRQKLNPKTNTNPKLPRGKKNTTLPKNITLIPVILKKNGAGKQNSRNNNPFSLLEESGLPTPTAPTTQSSSTTIDAPLPLPPPPPLPSRYPSPPLPPLHQSIPAPIPLPNNAFSGMVFGDLSNTGPTPVNSSTWVPAVSDSLSGYPRSSNPLLPSISSYVNTPQLSSTLPSLETTAPLGRRINRRAQQTTEDLKKRLRLDSLDSYSRDLAIEDTLFPLVYAIEPDRAPDITSTLMLKGEDEVLSLIVNIPTLRLVITQIKTILSKPSSTIIPPPMKTWDNEDDLGWGPALSSHPSLGAGLPSIPFINTHLRPGHDPGLNVPSRVNVTLTAKGGRNNDQPSL